MFKITEFTEARLASVTSRSEKHGDDEKPAVSLGIELRAANTLLDSIDPTLRPAIFKAVDDQLPIDGVEAVTPVLRCNSIERIVLPTKHEGWTLQIDDGIDDTTPMMFCRCKIDKLTVEPIQGGSIVLRLRVGTRDLDAHRSGFLGMHVGQSVWITLNPPMPGTIDGSRGTGSDDGDDDGQGNLLDDAEQTPESALADSEG